MDNLSGTPLDDEVLKAMLPYFQHRQGKEAKATIEKCREKVAGYLNAQHGEIAFTSGGPDALRTALISAIESTGTDHVITTPYEHRTVLEVLRVLQRKHDVRISYVKHHDNGRIDLHHLEYLLRTNTRNLISVQHANAETGHLNDIGRISGLAEHYNALLHIDAIQTLGYYRYDLAKLKTHFLTASADKFYGPKGIGFLYSRKVNDFSRPAYDKDFDDLPNAVGLKKALELAYRDLYKRKDYIGNLKQKLALAILEAVPVARFNGNSSIPDKSHFAILSVTFPEAEENLLEYLEEYHIAVSGNNNAIAVTIHFSLSKYNTAEEIDYVVEVLSSVYKAANVLKLV